MATLDINVISDEEGADLYLPIPPIHLSEDIDSITIKLGGKEVSLFLKTNEVEISNQKFFLHFDLDQLDLIVEPKYYPK